MILTYAKVAFVKIPRTGGTTVAQAILHACGMGRLDLRIDALNLNRMHERPGFHGWHVPLAEMHEFLGARHTEFSFFTVVREPVARLVSVYRWQRHKQPDNPVHADFATFVEACWSGDRRLRQQALLHALPQRRWVEDADGQVPPGLVLLATQRLDEGFGAIRRMTGLDLRAAPERRNVSDGAGVEVSASVAREIERRYAADVALHEAALAVTPGRLG